MSKPSGGFINFCALIIIYYHTSKFIGGKSSAYKLYNYSSWSLVLF